MKHIIVLSLAFPLKIKLIVYQQLMYYSQDAANLQVLADTIM